MRRIELWLAVRLLGLLVQWLPKQEQKETLWFWVADGQAEKHPFLEALKMITPAWRMRQPYAPDPQDEMKVALFDRISLASSCVLGHALSAFLIFTIVLGLLLSPSADFLSWSLRAAVIVVFLQWLLRHGLDVDFPWLRGSSGGSLVMFSAVVGPIVMLTLIPGTDQTANSLVFGWTYIVLTWDSFWGVKRPLRKKGFIRLFRRA